MTFLNWAAYRPNLSGAIIAVLVALFMFGKRIEETIWPVLHPPPVVSGVSIQDGKLFWDLRFCKERNLRLDSSGFTYIYTQAPTKIGVPVNAINETRQAPVSDTPLPAGCFNVTYSIILPKDTRPGDEVQGEVWYRSFHNFWFVHQDFGRVIVP